MRHKSTNELDHALKVARGEFTQQTIATLSVAGVQMLIHATVRILSGVEWEREHAICELSTSLKCSRELADRLIELAMATHSGFRVH